ncbi:MAG: hypothetical protein KGS48_12105 [Bacteroidetes bacterium]|nr:hypothetical protein [Bacteroidota bacterium]
MKKFAILPVFALCLSAIQLMAQQPEIQYYRPWNKDGINVFEPSKKTPQPEYTGFKLRIGGAFTQDFQSLKSQNTPTYVATSTTNPLNKNLLYGVIKYKDANGASVYANSDSTSAKLNGFNLAMANLNFDIQIADGIRVCLENYMSSRHHNEFWVKGGYIQIDKLPMFNNPKWYTDYVRVKIGHFQPNFGDMQFRRSDGGNTMYNPFVENLIFDAFTTEIGGEVYFFPINGLMVMGGMTSGFINGNIDNYAPVAQAPNVDPSKKSPSIFGKIAYDNQFGDLRVRLSASLYNNASSARNTLYAGDRTGSHYFMVIEPSTGTYSGNKDSGRFTSMGVNNSIKAVMINPFLKFHGLEVFGSYEMIKGRTYAERTDRKFNQLAVEGLYRFLKNESAYVGARYIQAKGTPQGYTNEITINRLAFAAGWFPTKNLLLKGEIVSQQYNDFAKTDYRNEAKFNGFMVEAVIGF